MRRILTLTDTKIHLTSPGVTFLDAYQTERVEFGSFKFKHNHKFVEPQFLSVRLIDFGKVAMAVLGSGVRHSRYELLICIYPVRPSSPSY